ncbi:hypothetical protein [Candidatus Phytoplasma bonamiae]|uniref:Uncharacterized protein n=1 Tax=Candidatus Phytoplasma bonamiae TaxID=2982626 RepID=A0ABT9D518_9MOLU|nr:hypothetical protein ['Bonamia sp.' little leaf phytoplasma]MDO8064092.1 hypothetical protein ['Bonamia sp.' little leaf phytoplasma]MDV3174455.1 hypothetical protein ['Bonamia sp.' little leaf phytoplasma]
MEIKIYYRFVSSEDNFFKLNYLFYGIINNKIIIFLTIFRFLFKLVIVIFKIVNLLKFVLIIVTGTRLD